MLSYQAIGAEQDMQAEPGRTSERLSGTRAATTFKKLPTARPGASASAAKAGFIPRVLSASAARELNQPQEPWTFTIETASFDLCGIPERSVPRGT